MSNVRPHSTFPMRSDIAFQAVLSELRRRFSWLVIHETKEHPQLEAFAEMPIQPGLSFPIQINLQNSDELHLVASHLWVEWFPCTNQCKRESFVEAVAGLLAGKLEIRETFVLGRPASATLCHRGNGPVRQVAAWSSLWTLAPLPRAHNTIWNQNAA